MPSAICSAGTAEPSLNNGTPLLQELQQLWAIARPPSATLLIAILVAVLASVVALAAPWVGGHFTDLVVGGGTGDYQWLLLAWLMLMLAQQALSFGSSYLVGTAGATATARLRNRLYEHLQALPLSFHHLTPRGELLSLLSRDTVILGQFFTTTLPGLLPQLLTLVGAWILMARISTELALAIGLLIPALALLLKLTLRRLRPLSHALAEAHSRHLGKVEENLRTLDLLKAFNREPREAAHLREHNAQILRLERRNLVSSGLISPLIEATGAILLIALLWLGASRLQADQLTPGGIVSLLLYGLLLVRPAGSLANAAANAQSTRGAATRLLHVLNQPPEDLHAGSQALPKQPGRLHFDRVSYTYPHAPPLLDELSLQIEPGQVVAITGPNGAGKSTLMHLLMRFMTPQAGRITMDGVNIAELSLNALRDAIGLVPQTVALVDGTLRDNISYGLPEAADDAIRQACSIAHAWEFIAALPGGLDTRVGPNGIKLSGGQRQKIALARALLRQCPILILDEATAMFDEASEAGFVTQARKQLQGTTILLITHRPHSLALAHHVLTLGNAPRAAGAPARA